MFDIDRKRQSSWIITSTVYTVTRGIDNILFGSITYGIAALSEGISFAYSGPKWNIRSGVNETKNACVILVSCMRNYTRRILQLGLGI